MPEPPARRSAARSPGLGHGADAPSEIIDLVDLDDRVIGRVAKERANRDPAMVHREVAVLIHRAETLLWQQRSSDKSVFPSCWDIACAGHVLAGESPQRGAHRELQEELGFDVALQFAGRRLVREPWETYFVYVFWGTASSGVEPVIDTAEVQGIQWGDRGAYRQWRAHGRRFSPTAVTLAEAFWERGGRRDWAAGPVGSS